LAKEIPMYAEDIKKYRVDEFILENYDQHPPIKAEMAVYKK